MKNPTALAVINFFTIGLGTLLYGKRPGVGLAALIGGSLLRYEEVRQGYLITGSFSIHWLLATIGLAVLGFGMAVDVYREASQGA